MPDNQQDKTLLDELEAIRESLDKLDKPELSIPTLDEIVEHEAPLSFKPDNPFLSSASLSELIKKRNEAESKAAEELARLKPTTSARASNQPNTPKNQPDPNFILSHMQSQFDAWLDQTVATHVSLFEKELRDHFQNRFNELLSEWNQQNSLSTSPSSKPSN